MILTFFVGLFVSLVNTPMAQRRNGWGPKPTKKFDISRASSSKKRRKRKKSDRGRTNPRRRLVDQSPKGIDAEHFGPLFHSRSLTAQFQRRLLDHYRWQGTALTIFMASYSFIFLIPIWFLCNFLSGLFSVHACFCSTCDSRDVNWIQFLLLMIVFLGWRGGELKL